MYICMALKPLKTLLPLLMGEFGLFRRACDLDVADIRVTGFVTIKLVA
jgi:hypothetical protein